MKFNDLKLFIAVVEAGGMTQAAVRLGLSQPGLSRTIRGIETRMGVELLQRTGRGVELTSAGERFLEFARQAQSQFETAKQDVQRLGETIPSALSIAVPQRTGQLLIPALHKRFAVVMPTLNVHIYEDSTNRMQDALRAQVYDMALIYAPPLPAATLHERLFTESLYLVGIKALIGPEACPVPLAEVAKLPLLLPSRSSPLRKMIETVLSERGMMPQIARELETSEALLAFALEGDGSAILPYSNVYREYELGEINVRKIVSPTIERTICLAIGAHTDRRLAASASQVIKEGLTALATAARWIANGRMARERK